MSLKATHALPTPTALALRLGWDQTRLSSLYSGQAVAPIIVVVTVDVAVAVAAAAVVA